GPKVTQVSAPNDFQCLSVLLLAGVPRFFEFIALFPADERGLAGGFPAESESEAGHGSVRGVIHAGMIFVARLVVMMGGVVGILRQAPRFVVSLKLHSLVD